MKNRDHCIRTVVGLGWYAWGIASTLRPHTPRPLSAFKTNQYQQGFSGLLSAS